jgi:hypothetical protein
MRAWSRCWPVDDIEYLRKRQAEGVSQGQIADELNRSKNSVAGKVFRLKLPRADKVLVFRTPKPRPKHSPKPRVTKTVQSKMAKKVKPPTPPPEDPPRDGVPLIKLRHHHCRNVVGRGKDGLATYCGKPRKWQSSFCPAHHAIFYVPAQARTHR